jgi:hypothetical protein
MHDPPPSRHFPVKAAIFEGGLALVALVLGAMLGVNPMRTLDSSMAAIGWGTLGAIPPLVALAVMLRVPWRPLRNLLDVVDRAVVPAFRQCGLVELGIISLLAGLGEELLFRGAIQEAATRAVTGRHDWWLGLVAASILFGMAHFITPMYATLATLMGLYLGGLWLWSGNLVVPIVTHAVYDFIVLAYLVKLNPPAGTPDAASLVGEDAAPQSEDDDLGQTQP